jgi:hypothetical protein
MSNRRPTSAEGVKISGGSSAALAGRQYWLPPRIRND